MMKWKKRMGAAFAAALMAASLTVSAGTMVFAEDTKTGTLYDSANIQTTDDTKTLSIDKYLVMDQNATVPNTTFIYKIEAGTAQTYTKTADDGTTITTKVLEGMNPNNITMSAGTDTTYSDDVNTNTNSAGVKWYTVKFDSTDDTDGTVTSTTYGGSESYDSTKQKNAKKTMQLDFTNCGFTEPGIYRYKLIECDSTDPGITNDSNAERYIDVYVVDATTTDATTNKETKKLKIAAYTVYTDVSILTDESTIPNETTTLTKTTGAKSGSFTNTYDTADLTFRKEVDGNQGSRDKYFKFTVTIDNAVKNTVYKVDISKADSTLKANSATDDEYEKDENSGDNLVASTESGDYPDRYCVTEDFYLQHGQEITIKGLAKDTVYTVTENAEDYTSTAAGVTNYQNPTSGTIGLTGITGTATAALDTAASPVNDVQTSYKNTRSGTIPTGIILTIAPFAAAVLIGGAGLVMILVKKRKAREN